MSLLETLLSMVLASGLILMSINLYQQFKLANMAAQNIAKMQSGVEFVYQVVNQAVLAVGSSRDASLDVYPKNNRPKWISSRMLAGSDVLLVADGQQKHAFYVAKTSRKNKQGQVVTALYEKVEGKPAAELLPGVVGLRFVVSGTVAVRTWVDFRYDHLQQPLVFFSAAS